MSMQQGKKQSSLEV